MINKILPSASVIYWIICCSIWQNRTPFRVYRLLLLLLFLFALLMAPLLVMLLLIITRIW